jgi:hypothetical protein
MKSAFFQDFLGPTLGRHALPGPELLPSGPQQCMAKTCGKSFTSKTLRGKDLERKGGYKIYNIRMYIIYIYVCVYDMRVHVSEISIWIFHIHHIPFASSPLFTWAATESFHELYVKRFVAYSYPLSSFFIPHISTVNHISMDWLKWKSTGNHRYFPIFSH